jgi:hypothetical protein
MLLVILGRGIQKTSAGEWRPTEDLEMAADAHGTHRPERIPPDDNNPLCRIGGGELNLLAGIELYRQLDPQVAVCAYGDRPAYLRNINAPNENEIMTNLFATQCQTLGLIPRCGRWKLTADEITPNTRRELENCFELALQRGIKQIITVTVLVHAWRLSLLVQELRGTHPEFKDCTVTVVTSEAVLLAANPRNYGARIRRMHSSKSFMRTIEMEAAGVNAILHGTYR